MLSLATHARIHGNANDQLAIGKNRIHVDKGGVFLCFQGTTSFVLDEKLRELHKGDICLYFPYSTLEVRHRSDDLDGIMMVIDIDSIQPLVGRVFHLDDWLKIRENPIVHINDVQMRKICQYVDLYLEHMDLDSLYSNAGQEGLQGLNMMQMERIRDCFILELIGCYHRQGFNTSNAYSRQDEMVKNFLLELQQHYREEHEVGYYASKQCLSMRYFSHIVKERTGRTPSQWIANALMAEARQLLLETGLTIKEISDRLHFPNQSYFGKWFKERDGVGPNEFRKNSLYSS